MLYSKIYRQNFFYEVNELLNENKIKMMKNLVISVEDETSNEEMTDEEVKAELVEDFKTNMKMNLKNNLLGKNDYPVDPFNELPKDSEPFDITSELEDEALYRLRHGHLIVDRAPQLVNEPFGLLIEDGDKNVLFPFEMPVERAPGDS